MTRYWGGEQDRNGEPPAFMDQQDAYRSAERLSKTIHQMREEIAELNRQIAELHRENLSLKVRLGMASESEAC